MFAKQCCICKKVWQADKWLDVSHTVCEAHKDSLNDVIFFEDDFIKLDMLKLEDEEGEIDFRQSDKIDLITKKTITFFFEIISEGFKHAFFNEMDYEDTIFEFLEKRIREEEGLKDPENKGFNEHNVFYLEYILED